VRVTARFTRRSTIAKGGMVGDLFEQVAPPHPPREIMAEGAVLLRSAALPFEEALLAGLNEITAASPFRHMVTPGGSTMSVAMTNCGAAGWVTDRTGYRNDRMERRAIRGRLCRPAFLELAVGTAADAGYSEFYPDACLINCYELVRTSRFIRIGTSAIWPIRSSPCRSVYPRRSSLAA
jgi:DNA oxidative demethylase